MSLDTDIKHDKQCFDCMRFYARNVLNMHLCIYCKKWFCDDCWNTRKKCCFTCEIKQPNVYK